MSHFFTVVMIADSTPKDGIADAVEKLLAPYNENLQVEPYKQRLEESEVKHYDEDDGLNQDEQGWFYISTRNPQAKWDWMVIGGRWNGAIKGNWVVNDPYRDDIEQNILHVNQLDHKIEAQAVVTPDGAWHEVGEMGWFGISHHDKEAAEWNREVIKIIQKHRGCILVGVDCHI